MFYCTCLSGSLQLLRHDLVAPQGILIHRLLETTKLATSLVNNMFHGGMVTSYVGYCQIRELDNSLWQNDKTTEWYLCCLQSLF